MNHYTVPQYSRRSNINYKTPFTVLWLLPAVSDCMTSLIAPRCFVSHFFTLVRRAENKKPCSDLINHILTKAEQPGRKVVFRPLTLYEDIYKDLMDMCIYHFILDAL